MSSESPNRVLGPPEGWQEKPLISVAATRFSSVDKLTHGSEEPVRLCNYTDVYNHDYITDNLEFMRASATQPEIDLFGLKVGDVIITKDSETPDDIGISTVVDYSAPDLICGYHLALLRPDQQKVDPTFLAKQLKHVRLARYFGQQSNGLTRYGLPVGAVNKTPLWLPELLDEQKAVGRALRLMDEAIKKTEAVIAKLRQVCAGLLHDLLTRGLDSNGQLRDPIAHPEEFQPSPLGQIPKEWRASPLGRECPLQRGFDITVAEQRNGDVPVVSSSGVNSFHDTAMVQGPGVVTGRKGKLGEVFYLESSFWPHDTSLWVTDFHGNLAKFIALLLQSMRLERFDAATSVPTLNRNTVHPLLARIPPFHEQEAIVQRVADSDDALAKEESWHRKLGLLKSGLMTDLLTGRVRLPAIEGGLKNTR